MYSKIYLENVQMKERAGCEKEADVQRKEGEECNIMMVTSVVKNNKVYRTKKE